VNIAPTTIADQRATLLRHVVLDRPSNIDTDDRDLFQAHTGLLVHAYMADRYAAALAELDPELAAEIAQELADELDAGALPTYAWHRAVELGHNPQDWKDDHAQALAKRAAKEKASQFKTCKVIEIRCALCNYLYDEDGEGVSCFNTEEQAVKTVLIDGWEKLSDGRVICADDLSEDHVQARAEERAAKEAGKPVEQIPGQTEIPVNA
jgi:hypothetical protein